MIGRWHGLVIDCPDPQALAVFYEKLLPAGEKVLALGARRLDGGGENFDVHADPAGHPFCLVAW
jgi:hypothetical protein